MPCFLEPVFFWFLVMVVDEDDDEEDEAEDFVAVAAEVRLRRLHSGSSLFTSSGIFPLVGNWFIKHRF